MELAKYGITVNAYAPGSIDTDMRKLPWFIPSRNRVCDDRSVDSVARAETGAIDPENKV